MRLLKNSFSRVTSMVALVALLTTSFVGLGDVKPASAGTVTTDGYGTITLPYSYTGTVSNTDCANPARGAGYYGDFFRVSSTANSRFYMQTGWDSYIQILDSNKTTIITQDDDSGSGVDAYVNTATVNTSNYIVASSYSPGGGGSYTFHSDVPLTQVTNCPQVITVSGAPSSIQYGSTGSFSASTNMGQPVTVTSQTPSTCSVASAAPTFTVTGLNPGNCSLVSSQSGNGSIEAAGNVTTNITITAKPLTISGLSGAKNYDGTTAVTFTGSATPAGVINSDVVSFSGTPTGVYNTANAGTNTITVSGLTLTGTGASKYTLTNTISGVISKINQSLSWSPTTARNTTSTGTAFTAATTTAGGGAITYSILNAGTTGCTVSGTSLSHTTSGTCVVRATAAATTNYNVATTDASFNISKVDQTITWSPLTTLLAMPSSTILSAATTSGNGVISYSISDAGTTGCSISGTTLSYTASGTCQVTATAAASNYYNAATSTLTFTINKATQAAITMSAVNSVLTYSAEPLATTTFSASGGNGSGAISFSVTEDSQSVCSISDNTITALAPGACVIEATKQGDGVYLERSGSLTVTVNKGIQSPIFVTSSEATLNFQADPLVTTTVSTSGGSGTGLVSLAVASSSASVCSISGNTVTALTAGNCVIEATKQGDDNYLERIDATTIVIDKALQSGFALAAAETSIQYQASPASTTELSTTGGSGNGEVSYLVQVGSNSVCSITGTTVTALTAGSCVITATKAADDSYAAATSTVTVTIRKVAQASVEVSATQTSLTYRISPAVTTTVSTTGGSGTGAISFEVATASSEICSVSGSTVNVLTAGTCVVLGTKAGDTNYEPESASVTIEIAKAVQETLVPSAASTSINFSESPAATTTLSSTGGSGDGDITYAPIAESAEVCLVTGNTLTALSAGSCVIEATKAASTNYLVTSGTVTVTINKIAQSNFSLDAASTGLTFAASPATTTTYSVSGGNGDGEVAVTVASSSSSICSISAGTVTVLSAGSCVLNATKASSTNYLEAVDTLTITIAKASQSALVPAATNRSITITGGSTTSALSFTGGNGSGNVIWTLNASSVGICSLSGTTVTAVASGSCVINLSKAGDANFQAAVGSITISVSAALQGAVAISAAETELTFSANDLTSTTVVFTGGNGSGRVWFESVDSNLCVVGAARTTVDGLEATVTALHAGTCEIRGHKDSDSNFAAAETELLVISVAKGEQSEFTITLESPLTYSSNPIASTHLIASGGSGSGNVTYSLVTGTCSLDNNELIAPNAGDCQVRAIKAGDQDFNSVTVENTFNIAKASQSALSVGLADGAPSTIAWAGKKLSTLAVSGGSGSGALSVSTNNAAICTATITGSEVAVTGVSAGECEVTVSKAATSNYLVKSNNFDLTVIDLPTGPENVTITNTGVVTDDGTAVDISWTPIASTGTQAEVVGYEVQFKSGLNWVRADGGLVDSNTTSITVYPTPWTALFIRVAPVSNYDDEVNDRSWTNYTGSSGGTSPVAFNIAGNLENISSPVVAATSGEVVFLTGNDFDQSTTNKVQISTSTNVFASSIGIAAVSNVKEVNAVVISPTRLSFLMPKVKMAAGVTQLASTVRILSANGVLSDPVSFSYVPKKLAQTISVTGLPVSPNLVVGTAVNGNLGALGAIPTVTGTANICSATIGENGALSISPLAKGKCVVTIQAPATPGYNAATAKKLNFNVLGVAQTISFVAPASRTWSDEPFDVEATASSELPVTFTSSTPLVCSVSDGSVSMIKAGVCALKAVQGGDTGFEAAPALTQSFTINKANRSGPLVATIKNLSIDGSQQDVLVSSANAAPTQANVLVAIGTDPLDRTVTLSQREGTVLFTVDSADDAAGRCIADPGMSDSLEGVITVTDLGSCKVTISQPADDRFNAGASVTLWLNASALNPDVEDPEAVDVGDGEVAEDETDTTSADRDTDLAVAMNLPANGGTFDLGGDVGIIYNPLKGLLSINTKTAFVGTFKVTLKSPSASQKWFTVAKKPVASCTLTLTVKKDPKLKKSVLRTIGAGCTLNTAGKAALTAVGVQKLMISYVFNRAYAKTGLNYMGTARAKTRILPKIKRTIVLKVGAVS